ncbi:hypothetical protein Pcal_0903 [Pyrobaculum calidifontis JCM 11548]|uniref:DUF1616 domain-containing protein n=2 Tax=Pyrobaculum calidifontis TaxID=181486 RepID=A3MUL1_PYRCJ|nr:hypothetical protein Pcal_0903 [Pyrobaculum calidifontis JCM 11548]
MTSAVERAVAKVEEEEERRPSLAVVVLGAVALLLLVVFSLVGVAPGVALGLAGGGGVSAVPLAVLVGWNGTQTFGLVAPVGALAVYDVYVCNVAGADVAVSARVVEAPPEVKVFLLYVNGTAFGYSFGNYTPLNAVFKAGQCLPARLEVLIDAKAQPNRAYPVAVEFTSHAR